MALNVYIAVSDGYISIANYSFAIAFIDSNKKIEHYYTYYSGYDRTLKNIAYTQICSFILDYASENGYKSLTIHAAKDAETVFCDSPNFKSLDDYKYYHEYYDSYTQLLEECGITLKYKLYDYSSVRKTKKPKNLYDVICITINMSSYDGDFYVPIPNYSYDAVDSDIDDLDYDSYMLSQVTYDYEYDPPVEYVHGEKLIKELEITELTDTEDSEDFNFDYFNFWGLYERTSIWRLFDRNFERNMAYDYDEYSTISCDEDGNPLSNMKDAFSDDDDSSILNTLSPISSNTIYIPFQDRYILLNSHLENGKIKMSGACPYDNYELEANVVMTIAGEEISKIQFMFCRADVKELRISFTYNIIDKNNVFNNGKPDIVISYDGGKFIDSKKSGAIFDKLWKEAFEKRLNYDRNSLYMDLFFRDNYLNEDFVNELLTIIGESKDLPLRIEESYRKEYKEKCTLKSLNDYENLIENSEGKYIDIQRNVIKDTITVLIPWLSARADNKDPGKLPNIAFLGGPGTGKTAIAKRIAKEVIGAQFLSIVPSEIKGAYIGQSVPKLMDKIKMLLNSRPLGNDSPVVLFIDEAYELFEQKDSFASDVVSTLLVLCNNDSEINFEYEDTSKKNSTKESVTIPTNFAVWIAGYEKQTRIALSNNSGMNRRFEKVVLPSPICDDLYSQLLKKCEKGLQAGVENKKEDIIEYFRWGCSPTYSEFFGNYAGIKRFYNRLIAYLKLKSIDQNVDLSIEEIIDSVIEKEKTEIRKQYKTVVEKKNTNRPPFLFQTDIKETFEKDYIGSEHLKNQFNRIIDIIIGASLYQDKKIDAPKGALLVGPPGTGKTYLARCMAGELEYKIKSLNSNKSVGFLPVAASKLQTAEDVQYLFSSAEDYDIVILFIDEIDIIGRRREELNNKQPLFQLLDSMDGFDKKKNIFVLAASNAPEVLDQALSRPGRLDDVFEVNLPDKDTRIELIKYYTEELKGSKKKKVLESISNILKGKAPADIKAYINKARLEYYSNKERAASEFDANVFVSIVENVIAEREEGVARKNDKTSGFSLVKNDMSPSSTAVHEVGHALMHIYNGDSFDKITILGRGGYGGYVSAETRLWTKADFINRIRACIGGRAAEEIIYGADNISRGASSDIRTASLIAFDMVSTYGMDSQIGLFTTSSSSSSYLGSSSRFDGSEALKEKMEERAMELITQQYDYVRDLFNKNKKDIERMAKFVWDKETLSGEEFIKEYNKKKSNK